MTHPSHPNVTGSRFVTELALVARIWLQTTVYVHHGLLLAPFDSLCNNPADVLQPERNKRRPFEAFLKK